MITTGMPRRRNPALAPDAPSTAGPSAAICRVSR